MARLYTWMRTKRIALAFCALTLLGAAGVWALQERQQPAGGPSALPAAGAAGGDGAPFSWPYEITEHSSMPRDLSFAEAKADFEQMVGEEVDMVGTAGAWAEISTPGTLLDVPLDVFEGPPPPEITVAYDFAIYFGAYGAAFERVSGVAYELVFVGEFFAAYAPPLGPEIVQWGSELAPDADLSAALAQAFADMGEGGGVYVMPSAMLRVEDPYVSTWQPTPIDTWRAGANFLYEFKVVPNQDPVAVVSATPTSGHVPLTVAFDGRGSSDPDGTIVNYAWTFGDGATASGTQAQVSHTYNNPNNYTATLKVTDDKGATDSASLTIEVIAVDRLVVKPAAVTLLSGGTQQFEAEGTWYGPDGKPDTADDETYDVTSLASWRVEPRQAGKPLPGTITDGGLFTAGTPAGDERHLHGFVFATLAIDTEEMEARAEVEVWEPTIRMSPDHGPIGTRITLQLKPGSLPARFGFVENETTVDVTGVFSVNSKTTSQATLHYPADKVTYISPTKVEIVLGEVSPPLIWWLTNSAIVATRQAGVLRGDLTVNTGTQVLEAKDQEFTITPSVGLGWIENGTFVLREEPYVFLVESLEGLNRAPDSVKLIAQLLIPEEATGTPPTVVPVTVKAFDQAGSELSPPPGFPAASVSLSLPYVGTSGGFYIYRSSAARAIIPLNSPLPPGTTNFRPLYSRGDCYIRVITPRRF